MCVILWSHNCYNLCIIAISFTVIMLVLTILIRLQCQERFTGMATYGIRPHAEATGGGRSALKGEG